MSKDSVSKTSGREPFTIFEIDMDTCYNTYGIRPCNASVTLKDFSQLIKYSEQYDQWLQFVSVTISANYASGPVSGTGLVASRIFDTSTTEDFIYQENSTAIEDSYLHTVSYYAKKNAAASVASLLSIQYKSSTGVALGTAHLRHNTATGSTAYTTFSSITVKDAGSSAIGSDWFRYFITAGATTLASSPILYMSIRPAHASTINDITANNSLVQDVILYGAQMNRGDLESYKTSESSTITIANRVGDPSLKCFNTYETCQDTPNYNIFNAEFNGSTSYAKVSAVSAGAEYSSTVSVDGWVKLNDITTQNTIALYNPVAFGGGIWHFFVASGGDLCMQTYTASENTIAIATAVIASTGVWYHVAGTYNKSDSGASRVFVDGVFKIRTVFASSVTPTFGAGGKLLISTSGNFLAGGYDDTFNGQMDNIRIYASAISSSQILGHSVSSNVAIADDDSTIVHFPMHKLVDGVMQDATGFSNDANEVVDVAFVNRARKTYRFCSNLANVPAGIEMFPAVQSKPRFTPTELKPGKGLGPRGALNVTLADFKHHDRGLDRYIDERSYDTNRGTFFGKFLARNKHFLGRPARLLTGYADAPFSFNNFDTRGYVIENIDGPDRRGNYKFTCKDILSLISEDKVKVPSPSDGFVIGSLSSTATTISVRSSSISGVYGSSGRVRIDDELVDYDNITASALTSCTRGVGGTKGNVHDASANVQHCVVYSSTNVTDVIYDLLIVQASVDTVYINTSAWSLEQGRWLNSNNISGTLHEPEPIFEIINELSEENTLDIWWDEIEQTIKLKVLAPRHLNAALSTITDEENVINESIDIVDGEDERISQVWVYYGKKNLVEDPDIRNFNSLYIQADLASEGKEQFGQNKIKVIKSRWLNSNALAIQFGGRMLTRYKKGAKKYIFEVDAKDGANISLANSYKFYTDRIQDATGSTIENNIQIIQTQEIIPGELYKIMGLDAGFFATGNFAFIGPNSLPAYISATDVDKQSYAFISSAGADFADGRGSYKII